MHPHKTQCGRQHRGHLARSHCHTPPPAGKPGWPAAATTVDTDGRNGTRRRYELPEARPCVRRQHDRQHRLSSTCSRSISIWPSFTALGSFLAGSLVGGRIGAQLGSNRARHLTIATTTQLLFVAGALVIALFTSDDLGTGSRYAIVLMAIAMGIQNTAARQLAVPIYNDRPDNDGHRHSGRRNPRRRARLKARPPWTLHRRHVARRAHRRLARPQGRQRRAPRPRDRTPRPDLPKLPRVRSAADGPSDFSAS